VAEAAGGFLAWLGASFVVLSDGRRGLALGTFLAAAGIALVSFSTAGALGSTALALGGVVAGAGRLRSGRPGWAIMPAGSTPRLVLCVAGGLLALWVGLSVMTGDDGGLRFAVMSVIGLAGARALGSDDNAALLASAALVALAVAAAVGVAVESSNVAPYAFAAAIAVATSWMTYRARSAA
jgi:hypothetical protein